MPDFYYTAKKPTYVLPSMWGMEPNCKNEEDARTKATTRFPDYVILQIGQTAPWKQKPTRVIRER